MRYYYQIYGKHDDDCEVEPADVEALRARVRCPECGTPLREAGPLPDISIRNDPARSAVGYISALSVGVVRADLADAIGREAVEQHLRLGRLVRPDGSAIAGYHTFVGLEPILLRGGLQSEHHLCDRCGAILYQPVPSNAPYITAPSVAAGPHLCATDTPRLVVDEAGRNRLGSRWDRLLKIYRLPVRDRAEDGLPDDLTLFPRPEHLAGYKPRYPSFYRPLMPPET